MKDGKYLSAAEKTKIALAFSRFVEHGFQQKHFTKALYKYLSLHFGFIAHFNQEGFYSARFASPDGRKETYKAILQAGEWNFRDANTIDCADLNKNIQQICINTAAKALNDATEQKKEMLRLQIAGLQDELRSLEGA